MDNIMVSVYCLAYNHEQYIQNALDGFVNQKTTFKYEVFVHDDASIDNTAQIIKEYAQKYPDVIKPIFQSENQYSKGVNIPRKIIFPKMQGKYIAICEGDDYWCDVDKLQKQVDFLEGHEEYVACVHNTKQINCITGDTDLINKSKEDMDLQFEKVVERGNSQFQLSSLLCRKEYYLIPTQLLAKGFGDYPLAIYLMFSGKVRYFKNVMSVYRLYANGSWTSRHYIDSDINKLIQTQKNLVEFLCNLLRYSKSNNISKSYCNDIEKVLRVEKVKLLMYENKGEEVIKNYKDIYNELSLEEKMKARFPFIRAIFRKLKSIRKKKNGKDNK